MPVIQVSGLELEEAHWPRLAPHATGAISRLPGTGTATGSGSLSAARATGRSHGAAQAGRRLDSGPSLSRAESLAASG